MAITDIACPPQSWEQFLAQTYFDSEWTREKIPGTNIPYARGGHYAYDMQAVLGDYNLFACGYGRCQHVDFGSALGYHQFVIQFQDGSGAFYAHTESRPPNGALLEPGDRVATMGDESDSNIGTHLHFEYLTDWNNWYTTANHGPQLRLLKEQEGMLSATDLRRMRNVVEGELGQFAKEIRDQFYVQSDKVIGENRELLRREGDAYAEVARKFIIASNT